jgi:hypothetical protein
MKFINILSSVISEKTEKKPLLREFNEKKKNELIIKFSGETEDPVDVISSYIGEFEKIQNSLPVDERNIDLYSYDELKEKIDSRKKQKELSDKRKFFKSKIIRNTTANKEQYTDYDVNEFVEFILPIEPYLDKKVTEEFITKPLLSLIPHKKRYLFQGLKKYLKQTNPTVLETDIDYYAAAFSENFDQIEMDKPWYKSSFEDIEHAVDGFIAANTDVGSVDDFRKQQLEDIPVVYQDDRWTVYEPRNKVDSIKLSCNRTWCISRSDTQNMYYNYRIDNNRTIFFVVDNSKPFDDRTYATVILISDDGFVGFADKTNGYHDSKYGGGRDVGWDFITSELEGFKDIVKYLKPRPFSQAEKEMKYKWASYEPTTDDLLTEIGYENLDKWLEINKTDVSRMTTQQFLSLPDEYKKKYITLGHPINARMIEESSPAVVQYMFSKQVGKLVNKSLSELTAQDVSLLNSIAGKKLKEELKSKLVTELGQSGGGNRITFLFPESNSAKIVSLYGFDEVLETIPDKEKIESFDFIVSDPNTTLMKLDLPNNFISIFPNIRRLSIKGAVIDKLPTNIGCGKRLYFITMNSSTLNEKLPQSLINPFKFCKTEPAIVFMNLKGVKFPSGYSLPKKEFAFIETSGNEGVSNEEMKELFAAGYPWFSTSNMKEVYFSTVNEA